MLFYQGEKSQLHESYLLKNNHSLLLVIRLVLFIYTHLLWWCQIYDSDKGEYTLLPFVTNLKFLTLCGANLVNLYFIFTVFDMIRYKISKKSYKSFWKVCHFLFQASFSCEITIFLLYWVGVYPSVSETDKNSTWYMFTTVSYHGGFFFCMYIEYLVNNISFKWRHYFLILIANVIYLIDNLIVTLVSKPVYKVMDWVSIKSYIFAVVAILVTFLHFSFGKIIYDKVKAKRIEALAPTYISQQVQISPEQDKIKQIVSEQQMVDVKTQTHRNNDLNSQDTINQQQQL